MPSAQTEDQSGSQAAQTLVLLASFPAAIHSPSDLSCCTKALKRFNTIEPIQCIDFLAHKLNNRANLAAIIIDGVLNGAKKRCKVVESSDLNDPQSGVIPSHMTPVFPRPLLYLSKTQTRLAADYFQGSSRVLDPDYCGYEGSRAAAVT